MNKQFLSDVDKGLSAQPKFLSSKYFYDEIGDKLFVEIMKMPEYYLFRAEYEIFKNQNKEIINSLNINQDSFFELIELGAGDGTKTKELLKELVNQSYTFDYSPVDISQHALDDLSENLKNEIPKLSVKPKQGEYFQVLDSIKNTQHPKVILFLGSNIGNLMDNEAHNFLYRLGASLSKNDKILLGVDLIKAREIVLPAYNDEAKITARFNLNLLNRINKELGGNFDLNKFEHKPEYTEEEGIARSFLVSTTKQDVYLKAKEKTYHFEEGEKIHTEISRKYNDKVLRGILDQTDFSILNHFTDSNQYFRDYILNKD